MQRQLTVRALFERCFFLLKFYLQLLPCLTYNTHLHQFRYIIIFVFCHFFLWFLKIFNFLTYQNILVWHVMRGLALLLKQISVFSPATSSSCLLTTSYTCQLLSPGLKEHSSGPSRLCWQKDSLERKLSSQQNSALGVALHYAFEKQKKAKNHKHFTYRVWIYGPRNVFCVSLAPHKNVYRNCVFATSWKEFLAKLEPASPKRQCWGTVL